MSLWRDGGRLTTDEVATLILAIERGEVEALPQLDLGDELAVWWLADRARWKLGPPLERQPDEPVDIVPLGVHGLPQYAQDEQGLWCAVAGIAATGVMFVESDRACHQNRFRGRVDAALGGERLL